MLKLTAAAVPLLVLAALPNAGAQAAVLGPDAHVCADGGRAMLVRIEGLKNRQGRLRVRSFAGPEDTYFQGSGALGRVEIPIPATGSVEVCMPVPRAGAYAVDVRHDANDNGKTDMSDGGGLSGNPEMSAMDVLLKHRPDPSQVRVRVVNGVTIVPIMLRYFQGGSFRPVGRGGR